MKKFLHTILAISVLVTLSSCAKSSLEDDTVPTDELIPREDITLTRTETEYVQANNSFALELFKNASGEEKGKSMLLSPLSITFAFGMVNNGAVGTTKDEINKTLGFGEDKGSIVLIPDAVNARYVMLHNGKNGTLYKIKGKGPRFWSKADLEKKGFESLGHEYYLVYELDTSKSADYPNLPALNRGTQTTIPDFMTWSELMDKKD